VAAAACDLKLKRLTTAEAEALPDTPDENGARRLYLLMEMARNRDDLDEQRRIVAEMESRFPAEFPGWPRRSTTAAIRTCCGASIRRRLSITAIWPRTFPQQTRRAAHWRGRLAELPAGLYTEAARLFDEQIRLYPGAKEAVNALYWRGRLYETQEHKPAQAAANYRAIIRAYQHFFYAQMARQRLAALGDAPAQSDPQPQLDSFQPPPVPPLMESFPSTARIWPRRACWPTRA
jgi:soluble lytic murein transglycosylase